MVQRNERHDGPAGFLRQLIRVELRAAVDVYDPILLVINAAYARVWIFGNC